MEEGQSLSKKKKESATKESTEGVSTHSFDSAIPLGGYRYQYDVFLSFRGSDTRKQFADHLYHGLVQAGNRVFRDDEGVLKGEEIGSQILDAIARSKILIPIISENYASSRWCLRELIQIMECKKSTSQIVFPIFYRVAPSSVGHLLGNFGEAFRRHNKQFDHRGIEEARQALREVSLLQGWESEKTANGYEAELVKLVVKSVLSRLREYIQLDIPEELVRRDEHLEERMNRVDNPSNNGRRMGIYDIGGSGMTTLARHETELKEFEVTPVLSEFSKQVELDVPKERVGHDGCSMGIMNQTDSSSVNTRMKKDIKEAQEAPGEVSERESEKIANWWKDTLVITLNVALILLFICTFLVPLCFFPNHPEMEKKSAERESTEGASAPSLISLIPTEEGGDGYDIFLSFRGPDTRKEFTDHLYHGLVNAGTIVFKDDNSIPIGKKFESQILDAITRSKMWILIISENYASSKWCLLELIHIMNCSKNKSTSHSVLPIFYKVKPSDVRDLKGSFGKAFHSQKKHFDKKVIQEGPRALREVSDFEAFVSGNIFNGHEGALVEKVIKEVLSKLRHDFQLDVTKRLVGIGDHVHTIKNWVDTPASDARMIGIYGIGGIGKTTLAKFIYNELSNDFVHRSSLLDIRETAQRNGILYLQNQLIKDIQPIEHRVWKVDDGISLIKSRFKGKKVLILLDDIDHKDQLNALARERNWYASGSIIIVTTRYEAVLDQSEFEVDYKYELNEIDETNSLLLFNRHAFRMNHSWEGFEGISRDIVSTTGGLPLALEIVGSYLYGKTNQKVWQDALKKLRKEPNKDVKKILKVSYDALEDAHKQIFLDIACFFIGEETKFAIYMWEDYEFYPSEGIEELKLRCLIKIDENGKLRMHDQLRDLGRSIVQKEGPLGKRSRLWANKEASRVLMEKKGTERIQAICLDQEYGHHQTYTNEQFKNIQSLRFLQLRRAALSGDYNGIFSELRWLRWFDIEPTFLPTNFSLPNLRVLELSFDQKTEHWTGWSSIQTAKRLKVLHLAYCNYLKGIPDLSTFPELEILIVKKSHKLEQVHPFIGKVKSLISLDLSDCGNLKELPREVGELEELKELSLDFAGIAKIPTSIGSLRKLEKLSCRGCQSLREIPSSIGDLSLLKILEITSAPILDLPESIRSLSSLQHLSLWGCHKLRSLPELPSGLKYLTVSCQSPRLPLLSRLIHLEELHLYRCDQLEYILELPSRPLKLCVDSCNKLIFAKLDQFEYLEELSIKNCSSIKRLDLSQLSRLKRLHVEDCSSLVEIQGHDKLESLEEIVIYRCKSIERLILPGLQRLKKLKASSCDNLVEIQGLDSAELLEALDISDCESIERLPDLSCFVTLKELNLAGCKALKTLPSLSKFENLENFTMRYLQSVTEIPGVEDSKSLTHVNITGCKSMEILPDLSGCEKLQSLVLQDCKKLTQLQGLEKLHLIFLDISGCDSLETIPELPGTRVFKNYERARYEVQNGNILLQ